MFSDTNVESEKFIVAAEIKRQGDDAHCQTAEMIISEKGTQTGLSKDFSWQTETIGLNESSHYDVDKLASFLRKIYPGLIEELENFDSTPLIMEQYEVPNEECTPVNLHNIELKHIQEKIVSSLSFSSDGKSLAVAFSIQKHDSWCIHTGEICVYGTNLDDYSIFHVKHILKTNSCVNYVSFHPNLPNYLACGLYNGQVFVWSLITEMMEQSIDDVHTSEAKHSDAVTSISWLFNYELFLSTGRDGVIIFWNYNMKRLTTSCCYFISSKYINPEKTESDHAEILCVGLWKNRDTAQFIVGTDGGNILHCSNSKNEISKLPHRPGFFDPFVMTYEPPGGIITCVACSGKDIFATCGTNYEIRIYRSREKTPFHVIYAKFPLLHIEWLGGSSITIACWGYRPKIYIYNMKTKDWFRSYSLSFNNPDAIITAVAISQNRSSVVAVTDKGELSIWMLPCLSFINEGASVPVEYV